MGEESECLFFKTLRGECYDNEFLVGSSLSSINYSTSYLLTLSLFYFYSSSY